jgi:hypothetical protein
MYCKQCGAKNEDGAVFCARCGYKFEQTIMLSAEHNPPAQPAEAETSDFRQRLKRSMHKTFQRFLRELLYANRAIYDHLSDPQPIGSASVSVLARKISLYRVITGFALVILLLSILF